MKSPRKHWRYGAALSFACLLAIAASARAQKPAPNTTKGIDLAAAHAERKAAVNDSMHLTPAEAKAFWPLYDEYEAKMDKIEERHIKEVHEYAKHYATLTDADAKAKLDEVIAIQQATLDTEKEYIPKFRAVISEIKTTRFFQIDSKLRALVQCDLAQSIPLAHRGSTAQ
jgi:Spy/CpxP family protein refolding chaperone